jgi:phosphatidate phosphatase APP1
MKRMGQRKEKQAIAPDKLIKKWGHALLERFRINTSPVIKVYNGFGTSKHMEITGHVLLRSPRKQEKFSTRFWKNTISLLRLFMVKPFRSVEVIVHWNDQKIAAITDETGHFHAIWQPEGTVTEGWHDLKVTLTLGEENTLCGQGTILVPPLTKYAIASDIDDTFLISHSSDIARRLYVLLTRNARTRRPFDGVVEHYQLLAKGDDDGRDRPVFYVSSSEWNLYDYIREFVRSYELPDGVYLLSPLKQLHEFWKTGHGRHQSKYDRIARLLDTYPERQFILLGDDSQEDPNIYRRLADDFSGRIVCVYLRHVNRNKLAATRIQEDAIKAAGVEICYFTHSKTAIIHSRKMGLIR